MFSVVMVFFSHWVGWSRVILINCRPNFFFLSSPKKKKNCHLVITFIAAIFFIAPSCSHPKGNPEKFLLFRYKNNIKSIPIKFEDFFIFFFFLPFWLFLFIFIYFHFFFYSISSNI